MVKKKCLLVDVTNPVATFWKPSQMKLRLNCQEIVKPFIKLSTKKDAQNIAANQTRWGFSMTNTLLPLARLFSTGKGKGGRQKL
mmetsp:Transcript_14174/g.25093  ORF Transcript_14174/g.25093 Transcript_14174/m.25093 type:complete len:84 (+) Transcript_14174:565-816(+)